MTIEPHNLNGIKIAEVIDDVIIIRTAEDGLDLLGNVYYQGFDKLLLNEKNITPEFFDLKTGIAGEILQKFSNTNYRCILGQNVLRYFLLRQ